MPKQSTSSSFPPSGKFGPGDPRCGRKPGVPNKATSAIKASAQNYGEEALQELVAIMRECGDPKTRLLAAKEILDRAYGRPAQTIQGEAEKPLAFDLSGVDEFTRRMAALAERASA